MLLLIFHIRQDQFAISAKQIIEILPLTRIKTIPKAPAYVAGLLDYRGKPVPIINLCQLCYGQDYNRVLSSRILLVNYIAADSSQHALGLIAEKVTETQNIADHHFTSSGISLEGMAYLGEIANINGSMIQYIQINELLSDDVQLMLFNNKDTSDYGANTQ